MSTHFPRRVDPHLHHLGEFYNIADASTNIILHEGLETIEMKILRQITGKTLLGKERSENNRRLCEVEDINGYYNEKSNGTIILIE